MSIVLVGSTSGSITLQEPAVAGSNTINLPAATGTAVLDTATQTLTNKTLTTPNIDSAQFATVSGTAPIYPCRAWVNFNGTTASPSTIRGSGNVTSVTKNGTGDYTVNFTNAMPDANYSTVALFGNGNTVSVAPVSDIGATPTTSAVRVLSYLRSTGAALDVAFCNVVIFR